MAAVLYTPTMQQLFDDDGNPLAGGKVYTYAAGTMTPKATYTDYTGLVEADNPVTLDDAGKPIAGNGAIWLIGSYKFIVKDSLGNTQNRGTQDNVTAFTTLSDANNAYFQTFSGDGTTTAFNTSDDLGTDEKGLDIEIYTGLQILAANGSFATDTIWTKGAGWTIGAGVATATGAISTALSQTAAFSVVAGQAYSVTYTITRSAGGLIPSVGGVNGVERTASGTYNEVIVAGSTQILAFTGNAFTGTLDNVSINLVTVGGWAPINPNAYTINGTALTFASAPPIGTNNIQVRAPSLLLGAASAAAGAAAASAAAALTSETNAAGSASSAAAYALAKVKWTYSSTTAMAAPGSSNIRLNNATLASVTAIAISDLSADSGTPDLSGWINTWDDGSGSNRGTIYIFKDNSNFALYNVNSSNVDNTTWNQISVTYLAGQGSFTNLDAVYLGFAASGVTTVTGGITALTSDVTASGSGSVAATIANGVVTLAKIQNAAANSRLVGSGASGAGAAYSEITLGSGLSMTGTTLSATAGLPTVTTNVTTSGTTSVFTVDFTTNQRYSVTINGLGLSGSGESLQIEFSSNAGASYAATTYEQKRVTGTTVTDQTANIVGLPANGDLANGTIEIWQDSTSGVIRFSNLLSNNNSDIVQSGGGTGALSAACDRIRFSSPLGSAFDAGSISINPVAVR